MMCHLLAVFANAVQLLYKNSDWRPYLVNKNPITDIHAPQTERLKTGRNILGFFTMMSLKTYFEKCLCTLLTMLFG